MSQSHRSPILTQRPARALLYITPNCTISSPNPPPNFWWRFWHWALLGWRWERL